MRHRPQLGHGKHASRLRLVSSLLTLCGLWLCSASAPAQARLEARPERGGTMSALPLTEETLRVRIDQQHAHSSLKQSYQNESSGRLEGRYKVHAGDGATVTGFAYYIGEKRIVGEVFERNTAQQIYREVTGLGRDPGLLEKVGEGAFSFRVFPIEPGEKKRIEIEVDRYLYRRGDRVRYRMPLSSASADIKVELEDPRSISHITSPSHQITVDRQSDGRIVVRTTGRRSETKSFELVYQLTEPSWTLSGAVHRDAGEDAYLMLSLPAPRQAPTAAAAKDVSLVLDRSGSMSGAPLKSAVRAAEKIVRRMGRHDRLNIIAFDDDVDALYKQPRSLSDKVRDEALRFLSRLGDGGGTDIARALAHALKSQERDARPDVVLFLTDGQSDAQAALKVAQSDRGDVRVFTVGIGGGVNKPLLSRLAAMKRGRFTFIASNAAIESKMSELYSRIEQPLIVDLKLDIDGAQASRIYPRRLPDVFNGDELTIRARLRGSGPATVTVSGKFKGKTRRFVRKISIPAKVRRPWVGRHWADARIQDLLEEVALRGERKELKDEIVDLGLAYNLVNRYTAFLAIPESELTDQARRQMESARAHKKRVLAANPDALKLSRSVMPPGDPVLKLSAPKDAKQVTAYFPFGLVKDLAYDDFSEKWKTRFLVPKGVADGHYKIHVVIVDAQNVVKIASVEYEIDSAAPRFDVDTRIDGAWLKIRVTVEEKAREVRVMAVGKRAAAIALTDSGDGQTFTGQLALSGEPPKLRVVVADVARNESSKLIILPGQP